MAGRRYSKEFKADAIRQLAVNGRNFRLTSSETGVHILTLRKWWLEYQEVAAQTDAEIQSLNHLRHELIENALRLARELRAANGSVTFSQRATALNQLMDKVIRLMDKLPEEEVEEMIHIAYEENYQDDAEETDMEDYPSGGSASEAGKDSAE